MLAIKTDSDFNKYKRYKKDLKPCTGKKIISNLDFKLSTNSSLNLSKFNKYVK